MNEGNSAMGHFLAAVIGLAVLGMMIALAGLWSCWP